MSRISFVVVMGSLLLFLGACTRESNYDRLVKTEMANGVYSDSLKFGLLLGDTKKTFYHQVLGVKFGGSDFSWA
jgi:hypothetical protein